MYGFLIGLTLGIMQIGSISYRMVHIIIGNPIQVFLSGLIINLAYFFSITIVVDQDIIGYLGFALGASLVTTWLSYKNRVKDDANRNREEVASNTT